MTATPIVEIAVDYRLPHWLANEQPDWILREIRDRMAWAANPFSHYYPQIKGSQPYLPSKIRIVTWAESNDIARVEGERLRAFTPDDSFPAWIYVYFAINDNVGGFVKRDPYIGMLCTGGSYITEWNGYLERKSLKEEHKP